MVRSEIQTRIKDYYPKGKKTYGQDWTSYNEAKSKEKILLMYLLRELTSTIPTTERIKQPGRPRLDKDEMLFCMTLMLYGGRSSRVSVSDFRIAKKLGFINHVPNFNTINKYFNLRELEYELKDLITISSLPLKQFDKGLITIDASGFGTHQFSNWLDNKWGKVKNRRERVWRKASIVSGVKTGVITAVEITDGRRHDSLMFNELVEHTVKKRGAIEVSADKAYSSRKIFNKCQELGVTPYIPFKKNATGHMRGSLLWPKMFKLFTEQRELFESHYTVGRSRAENIFSVLKRCFNHQLRNKLPQAQTNEILCMCLCHNLCCIVKAIFKFRNVETDWNKYSEAYFA